MIDNIYENFNMLLGQISTFFVASFSNRILILCCSAHIFSMVFKLVLNSIKNRKFNPASGFNYGGMPSSHTVFIMSFVFGIAFDKEFGFNSAMLIFSIIMASIILMDAIRLRGVVDKLNIALTEIVKTDPKLENKISLPKFVAHKTNEVIAGIIFAFIYTFLFYLFFYHIFKISI
jgi:acid phosphatase family membrane protein YuiD